MNVFSKSRRFMKIGSFLFATVFLINVFTTVAMADEQNVPEILEDLSAETGMTLLSAGEPNAIQCGTMTSTKGFARKPVQPPDSDEYFINFHYMYPTGAGMDGFALWGSYDGAEYDDLLLYQTGDRIDARVANNRQEFVDITLEPDVWHNILIHVKADGTVSLYINGVQAKIGNAYSQPQLGNGKIQALGYFGDLSTAAHNGMAYYDNIRLFTKDEILVSEDFNGPISDWTFYTTAFLASPSVNIDMPVFESLEIVPEKGGLMTGTGTKLHINGYWSDGTKIVTDTAKSVIVESDNPEVLKVQEENGEYFVHAVGVGSAVITAKVQIHDTEQTASVEIAASDEPFLYDIALQADRTVLLPQDTERIFVSGLLTDDTTTDIVPESITYISTDPSVVSVYTDEYGIVYAKAEGIGQARIIAHAVIDGKAMESSIRFSVVDFAGITLSAPKNNLFIGDIQKINVTGYLTDGSEISLINADSMGAYSNNENVAVVSVIDGIPTVTVTGVGTATVTVEVTLRGTVKSGQISFTGNEITNSKTRRTYYRDDKVEAARRNVEIYDWAQSVKDAAVAKADVYVNLGYDFLWNLVTPQSIPRSYGVNQTYGCLNCGNAIDAFGNYPYLADPINDPWKLECPSCHMKFPTNDFAAYYESGKDEHGIFRPELADRSLLVNTLYPEKGETWGVDDGFGYVHTNGRKYTFIAYYNHWHVWYGGIVSTALNNLRDAYIYTGDMKYARAGIILLDRVADVYPDMDIWPYKIADGFLNSNGNSNRGKVVGSIWETGLARDFLKDYDAFFPAMDDPETISFLSQKADEYGLSVLKKSGTGIRRNIEDGIVRQIFPAVKDAKIRGNNGMHQSTLAMAAVVLDTMPETKEWLDFNFQSGTASANAVTGGNILASFVNDVDRDGHGNEAAPGYNRLWLGQYIEVANILDGYDLYPAADLYENPKFKKMFYSMISVLLTDKYSALIGDTGSTGNPGVFVDINQTILAFERYKDPLLAQIIYFLNGNRTEGIHGNIFSSNPDSVANEIQAVIDTYGTFKPESDNATGYGLAVLRDGDNITVDFGINYEFILLPVSDSSKEVKNFMNNRTAQLEASEVGDYASFLFEVLETDLYEMDLKHLKAGSYGIYDVYLDGEYLCRIDFCGSGMTVEKLADRILEAGVHEIRFECVGKLDISTNYKMGVTKLLLLDEQARYLKDTTEVGDTQRAVWMYYGVTSGHGHADTLNLGIHGFGLDLTPELGYPEYADSTPHRLEWVSNIVSHNTVVVNKSKQDTANKVEDPLHFDAGDMVQLTDVNAPKAYRSKNAEYRRTSAMIKVDSKNFYVVDFFRVKGGNDHHFSFHGAEGTVTVEGLNLVPQADAFGNYIGTYAGPDTEFGIRPSDDTGNSGFHWLINVRKDDSPGDVFSVDWNVKDTWNALGKGYNAQTDIHLRLTMLEQTDSVAIATGIPPRNKPGNPSELEYLIAHRSGSNLDSLFTSVIEPYEGERFISHIEKVSLTVDGQPFEGNDARAVKVVFTDGRVDYIVYSLNNQRIYTVDGKFSFQGFFGVYSERDGIPYYSYINDGYFIGELTEASVPSYTGTVLDFTKSLSLENDITVAIDGEFDPVQLIGRYIYVENDGVRNAVYRIKGIKEIVGNTVVLDIGDVTTVRRWVDTNDFSKGFVYDLAEGRRFTIPLSNEYLSPFTDASLSVDKTELIRGQTANVSVDARFQSGAPIPMDKATVEIISSDPDVIRVRNGVLEGLNPGTAKIYAKVKYLGITAVTEQIDMTVTVTAGTLNETVEAFVQSNELTMPLSVQVRNSLKQAEHFIEKGKLDSAIHHLEHLLKHLNNEALQEHVSENAKKTLNADVNGLINLLKAQ
jgi:hypothetical protein